MRIAFIAVSVAKLGAGDTLDIGHFGEGTGFAYAANAQNTGGTLPLTNGKASTKLTLVGSYSKTGFKLTTGASDDTLVSYTAPKASAWPEVAMAAVESQTHMASLALSLFEGAFGGATSGTACRAHAIVLSAACAGRRRARTSLAAAKKV